MIQTIVKTSMVDYPREIATTLFTGGCNFRCPFCQNAELVLHPYDVPGYTRDQIMNHLEDRRNILTAVCISGGEPTLWGTELTDLCREIKTLGYKIKLDTNGTRPDVIRNLINSDLIDYVAMDIKTSLENYPKVSGIPNPDTQKIRDSVELLFNSDIPFEFRTTVVKELHSERDFEKIADWLKGAPAYYLQRYWNNENNIQTGLSPETPDTMQEYLRILQKTIPNARLR